MIHQLLQQRNAHETDPYVQVYTSIDNLRKKCQRLEHKCCTQESAIAKLIEQVNDKGPTKGEIKVQEKLGILNNKLEDKERK
eukprot:scaffold4673_cov245-Chaetoceros_neogracile.AAC.7